MVPRISTLLEGVEMFFLGGFMRERLEKLFRLKKSNIKVSELVREFNLDYKQSCILIDELYELEKEGKIYCTSVGTYTHMPEESCIYHGIVRKSNKGKYYIISNIGIINIENKNLNSCHENDIVFVEIKKGIKQKHLKQLEGKVIRKVEKTKLDLTNIFYKSELKKDFNRGRYFVIINDALVYISSSDLMGANVGDIVTVHIKENKNAKVVDIIERKTQSLILKYTKRNNEIIWTPLDNENNPIEVLFIDDIEFNDNDRILVHFVDNKAVYSRTITEEDNLENTIKEMLFNTGTPIEFSKEAIKEAKRIEKQEFDMSNRVDFRDLVTITIDGENAKDLDDAISLKYDGNIYTLYVHIADVSHFVRPGSELFEEAYERGTSVYPSNFVIPMLPEELSNGVCSLNPKVDRLTKTCIIKFDNEGNIIDYNLVNSVINSNYRMNYKSVNNVLKGETEPGYEEYEELLKTMNRLSKILQNKKIKRGALTINSIDLTFNLDENEKVESIKNRDREDAELLIENFMLVANHAVSSFVKYMQVPFMFRNHESPDLDQLKKLKYGLQSLKKYINSIKNLSDLGTLSRILSNMHKEKPFESMHYSEKILGCMKRAYYSSENKGHYALALSNYATFTSPIRRFPDLVNHYVIGEILEGRINNLDEELKKIEEMCFHSSETQLNAEMFEKQIDNMLLNRYLLSIADDQMDAEIQFIDHDFIGIKTSNGLYGSIDIKKATFKNNCVIINGVYYRTGEKIIVTICDAPAFNNQIKFNIVSKKEKAKQLRKEKRE